jgi:hypothetical protein
MIEEIWTTSREAMSLLAKTCTESFSLALVCGDKKTDFWSPELTRTRTYQNNLPIDKTSVGVQTRVETETDEHSVKPVYLSPIEAAMRFSLSTLPYLSA